MQPATTTYALHPDYRMFYCPGTTPGKLSVGFALSAEEFLLGVNEARRKNGLSEATLDTVKDHRVNPLSMREVLNRHFVENAK